MAKSRMITVSYMSRHAVLQNPYTCIVAGCTQSGKTVWVKTLLENAQKTKSPPPQRIICCQSAKELLQSILTFTDVLTWKSKGEIMYKVTI